jgi:CheY-like chemotaxis protein
VHQATIATMNPSRHEATGSMPAGTRRGRVLLVDDEPILLRGLKRTLSEHDVVTATSVAQGIQLYEKGDFDIVFCDLMMPETTGLDFYSHLCALGHAHASRLVLMTGGVFADRLGCSLSQIRSPCIMKPFAAGLLERLIDEAVVTRGR